MVGRASEVRGDGENGKGGGRSATKPSPSQKPGLPLQVETIGDDRRVRRDPKVLRRVSRILIKEGLHFANLFYIFE
jgi:hypothetical protein